MGTSLITRSTGSTRSTDLTRRIGRCAGLAVLAALAVGPVLTTAAVASSEEPTRTPTWNAMEHEAHRSMAEAGQEQARVLNPREHEAHRPASVISTAGRTVGASPCSQALSAAWEKLGHFSDGMETWMLSTAVCTAE